MYRYIFSGLLVYQIEQIENKLGTIFVFKKSIQQLEFLLKSIESSIKLSLIVTLEVCCVKYLHELKLLMIQ